MVRLAGASGGHLVADCKVVNPFTNFDDFARGRIANAPALRVQVRRHGRCRRCANGRHRRLTRARQPVFDDLGQPARGFARILEARAKVVLQPSCTIQAALNRRRIGRRDACRPQRRHLRPHADERVAHADQHRARLDHGSRHAGDGDAAHVHH